MTTRHIFNSEAHARPKPRKGCGPLVATASPAPNVDSHNEIAEGAGAGLENDHAENSGLHCGVQQADRDDLTIHTKLALDDMLNIFWSPTLQPILER